MHSINVVKRVSQRAAVLKFDTAHALQHFSMLTYTIGHVYLNASVPHTFLSDAQHHVFESMLRHAHMQGTSTLV